MPFLLAATAILRHPTRSLLAIIGVAISAAMLLDMVMLSSGMRQSFSELLLSRGFQLRIAPKGTLPFDSEATIAGAAEIRDAVRVLPGVTTVSPVLGASIHTPTASGSVAGFALGVDPLVQGDYALEAGREPAAADEVVLNAEMMRAAGVGIGDTVRIATGYDPQLRTFAGSRRARIVGRARFLYLAVGQRAAAMPIATLQRMAGADDRASLFMVRVTEGTDIEAVRQAIERRVPRVTAISIATALEQVDERLSYFRQLAIILGAVSLVVGFLLVTTLITVSVNERVGEIAVMRAIGVSRWRIVQQIAIEGIAISLAGAALGLALGLVTARWLNAILISFPGLPAAIDFFLFRPRVAWTALAMLTVSGIAAGLYPAWRGASLPIAATLREEAVG